MIQGKININVKAENAENAKKIGFVLQNISDKVSEADLLKLNEVVCKNPSFFSNIISKLNNPIISKALGI